MNHGYLTRSAERPSLWAMLLATALAGCASNQGGGNVGVFGNEPDATPNTAYATAAQDAMIRADQAAKTADSAPIDPKKDAERERNLHLKLVQDMMSQNNAYAALAHLDAYDQKWGANRQSRLIRADAYRKTGQLDKAELAYRTLLNGATPGQQTGALWYGLGKVSVDKDELGTAAQRFEKAAQSDPLNINAYTDLGLVYLLTGRKDEAYNNLMKATQLANGENPTATANLALWGLVYGDTGLAQSIADQLKWTDSTRKKVTAQANVIRKRLESKGVNP